jgi:hypothetical protein
MRRPTAQKPSRVAASPAQSRRSVLRFALSIAGLSKLSLSVVKQNYRVVQSIEYAQGPSMPHC